MLNRREFLKLSMSLPFTGLCINKAAACDSIYDNTGGTLTYTFTRLGRQ